MIILTLNQKFYTTKWDKEHASHAKYKQQQASVCLIGCDVVVGVVVVVVAVVVVVVAIYS